MVAALLTDVPVLRYVCRITIYSLLISNLSFVIPLKCQLLYVARLIRKATELLLAFYEFPSHCNHAVYLIMVVVTENKRKLFTEAGRDRHLVRYYTARHDTLHAFYFDKVSWDDIGRDRSLYAY